MIEGAPRSLAQLMRGTRALAERWLRVRQDRSRLDPRWSKDEAKQPHRDRGNLDPMGAYRYKPRMSACEHLLGISLIGQRTRERWDVVKKLETAPDLTPGNFSVGYVVKNSAGREAFCKASDIGMFANGEGSFLDRLQRALGAQAFERKVLEHCRGSNMDRVVTALDYGDIESTYENVRDRVFFLIFEMAQGDLRRHVTKQEAFDLVWSVNALHNFAVAVRQLHEGDIYHNDLKPANALIFDELIQKIADLGRATSPHIPAEHDTMLCAGDRRFAAPEQLYPQEQGRVKLEKAERYRAGDLYALGSLAHYLLSGRSVTPEVIQRLRPEHKPRSAAGGFGDSFERVLPYWRAAFENVMEQLPDSLMEPKETFLDQTLVELIQIVRELCEPDPMLRGHPRNRAPGQDTYALERYISRLDKLRNQLIIKSRKIV